MSEMRTWVELVLGILGISGTVLGFLFWLYRSHSKQIRSLEAERNGLRQERDEAKTEFHAVSSDLKSLREKYEQEKENHGRLKQSAYKLQTQKERFREEAQELRVQCDCLQHDLTSVRGASDPLKDQLSRLQVQSEKTAKDLEHVRGENHRLEALSVSLADERDLARAERDQARATIQAVREQAYERANRQAVELAAAEESATNARASLTAVQQRYDETRSHESELRQNLHRYDQSLRDVIAQGGRVWERPIPDSAPKFRQRAERGVPIISVLNLKGGVGKTTITANLAGILAGQGKRVLAIDLDYQRSLSAMLLSNTARKELHFENRTLQSILARPEGSAESLWECAAEVHEYPNLHVITNSDRIRDGDASSSLEEIEMHRMIQWMVQSDSPDPRMMLRNALHDTNAYPENLGYVLLDCPPRLTTACMNALAASDFVLIPVIPDGTSYKSVPDLLRRLRRLQSCRVLPELRVLGIVASLGRMSGGELIKRQQLVWEKLAQWCKVAWSEPIYTFRTTVRYSPQLEELIKKLESGRPLSLGIEDDEMHKVFSDLAKEIKQEIRKHESRSAAAVPSQPERAD